MGLGISNIVIGLGILGAGAWQYTRPEVAASLVTAFLVAGAGAIGVGAYQLWRHRYVYNDAYGDGL